MTPALVELRALLVLAAPVVAAQLGVMLLGVVDTAMIGHFAPGSLGGAALATNYAFGVLIVGQGVLHALDPLVAQAYGAGERDKVAAAFARGSVVAVALSLAYMALFRWSAPILTFFGQPPEMVALADPFLEALAPGVPAFLGFVVLRQTLQAMGAALPVFIAVVVGNVGNVFGNLGLMYGRFGLPRLGVVGSAWSTTTSRWLMLAVLLALALPRLRGYWPRWASAEIWRAREFRRLLAIGVPTGAQIGLEMWAFTAATMLIGALGAPALAAHQIALTLASLSFMVPLGVGAAAAARVGQAIGRGDAEGARRAAQVALATGGGVMLLSAVVFFVVPHELSALFSGDLELVARATPLVGIAALFQIFDGTQAVGCGILRGAADTRVAAGINFVGYWVVGLPLGVWLSRYAGLAATSGARGIWWGLTAGLALVAVLLVWRVHVRFSRPLARVDG